MSWGIEVNSNYRGVAASWFGLDTNIYAKNNQETVPKKCSDENKVKNDTKTQNTTFLIKDKLEKKMSFAKKYTTVQVHKRFDMKRKREEDEEEVSKSFQVKTKKERNGAQSSTNEAIKQLNERLLDKTLSKSARKNIRKKIAKLSQQDT